MEDDFLRSLGGPAQGDAAFLEKVARTQKKLGNINVDQMVGLGPPTKLGKGRLASASGISPDPQAQPKEVSAPTKMQGAPPPHSLGHEPVVATAPRKEQQAPALGIKIPDLTDLSLELPAPRSLARDFAGHNKALEQMLAQAHQMQNEVLELRVQTAIVGNEIARLDNPILRAKLQSLSLTADRILASTDK
ncbi:hypothetical protein WJX84_011503 [Apatococcus fuscideae]|uniref:Uncharacterized protein n=1 Tax=Apatococcus fuscideae TaxID=2026836 RepID=A0AAW1SYC6_9CHLO